MVCNRRYYDKSDISPRSMAFVVYVVLRVWKVPTYLEIALRAATPAETQVERRPERPEPRPVLRTNESLKKSRLSSAPVACGSPGCAGCYEVEPGLRIHPPKSGEDYRAWLERWEVKGSVQ